jgi:hypothetical protein
VNKAIRFLLCTILPVAWAAEPLLANAQSQSSQPAQSSQQSQTQSQPQPKDDSVAEAARKAKEKKAASPQGKIFTEDDLSGMRKEGVSVVGTESKKTSQLAPARTPATPTTKGEEGDYEPNSEHYWREKARPILEEIAVVTQQMEQLKEDIKKYGNAGFDVATGMKDNIAYVLDRNAKIEKLQKRKAVLEKQLDDLQEEGRKAGADPAWFR